MVAETVAVMAAGWAVGMGAGWAAETVAGCEEQRDISDKHSTAENECTNELATFDNEYCAEVDRQQLAMCDLYLVHCSKPRELSKCICVSST